MGDRTVDRLRPLPSSLLGGFVNPKLTWNPFKEARGIQGYVGFRLTWNRIKPFLALSVVSCFFKGRFASRPLNAEKRPQGAGLEVQGLG